MISPAGCRHTYDVWPMADASGTAAGAQRVPRLADGHRALLDRRLLLRRAPRARRRGARRSEEIERGGLEAYASAGGAGLEETFETLLTGLAVRYYKAVAGLSAWVPRVLLGLGLIGLAAAIYSISVGSGGPQPAPIGGVNDVQRIFGGIAQDGAYLGPRTPTTTITVFNDLQCAPCADYEIDTIDPLVEEYARTGEARIEFRHFSLAPNDTTLAAIAAEAAGVQDRQWQYLDTFCPQPGRGAHCAASTRQFLREVAEAVPELDTDQWADDYRRPGEPRTRVRDDAELAAELKLPPSRRSSSRARAASASSTDRRRPPRSRPPSIRCRARTDRPRSGSRVQRRRRRWVSGEQRRSGPRPRSRAAGRSARGSRACCRGRRRSRSSAGSRPRSSRRTSTRSARAAPAAIEKKLNGITGHQPHPEQQRHAAGLDHALEPLKRSRPTNR